MNMRRAEVLNRLRASAPVIAPSMLQCDFANLQAEVAQLAAAGAQVLHWDVMDGHFVPNLSYGALIIAPLRSRCELVFDAHLMVSRPHECWQAYREAGCQVITFHVESEADPLPLIEQLQQADCVAGIALNPETPVEPHAAAIARADYVLLMSVHPGAGGQAFLPEVLDKVPAVRRAMRPEAVLAIDGGIGERTISQTASAGVHYFVVGSAIFRSGNYLEQITSLRHLAEEASRLVSTN